VEHPGIAGDHAAARGAISPPRGFPLIGDVLPLARDTLEQAIGGFLTRIADLSGGRAHWSESPATVLSLSVLLIAVAAREAVRGLRWSAWSDGEETDECDEASPFGRIGRHGLPGLPSAR
jgi:hypothetical protein